MGPEQCPTTGIKILFDPVLIPSFISFESELTSASRVSNMLTGYAVSLLSILVPSDKTSIVF